MAISDPQLFLERIGEGKTITSFRAGEIVFKQGTPATAVYYLQTGKAKESVTSDQGKDAVVDLLEPGFFFGINSLNGRNHGQAASVIRMSTVTAITRCVVTILTAEAMTDALKDPTFSQFFLMYLLQTNHRIEAEKIDLLLNPSEKRLAQKLLMLAHFGEGPTQTIGPEITQEMLAEMIGTTRPRVNFFLNRFRNNGLIKYNGGITVLPGLLTAVLLDGDNKVDKE